LIAAEQNWGLFNRISMPFWLEVAAGVILMDLVV